MKFRSRAKGISRLASLSLWGPRSGSPFFLMLAMALFAVSAVRPASLQAVRTGAVDALAPVLSAVNWPLRQAADYARAVTGLAALQGENARLAAENARLREWYQTAQSLQHENAELRKSLNIREAPKGGFVTARVVADAGNAYVKSLLVLAGRSQAVDKGHAVLTGDGLIGRVVEAGQRSARVLLLTDINSRIPVQVQGSGFQAILGGDNGDLPVLLHLPRGAEIGDGARVVTSGHGGLFPYGLPVGEVVRQGGRLAVRPYAHFDRLTFVRIIGDAGDPNFIEGDAEGASR